MAGEVSDRADVNIAARGEDGQRFFGKGISPGEGDGFIAVGEFEDERGDAGEEFGEEIGDVV
jgi:hypothetical protein